VITVCCIVEGDGEVQAFPVLLHRINAWLSPGSVVDIVKPIRVRRDRFINKDEEFRRHLLLAAEKTPNSGWIIVLLDADDDCPATLAAQLLRRAQHVISHRQVSVILANREYEAWLIAAANSLDGCRGFVAGQSCDAETPRDAAGWVRRCMSGNHYGKVADQAAFSARMSLDEAHAGSRSFRKLCSEWTKHILPI
jgi:hypothetical protein